MTNNTECPECKGNRVVSGKYLGQTDHIGIGQAFRPDGLKFTATFGTDLRISKEFRACLDCGLLWQRIDQAKLGSIIQKKGKPEVVRVLGLK